MQQWIHLLGVVAGQLQVADIWMTGVTLRYVGMVEKQLFLCCCYLKDSVKSYTPFTGIWVRGLG